MTSLPYDEFGLFSENATEFGLTLDSPPAVRRVEVHVQSGTHGSSPRFVSALVWGSGDPQLVLVHGGAQNAHTWDTVALALGVSLVAVDLAGHGHSGWRDDGAYTPINLADDLAIVVAQLAPHAVAVVGMSLGGLTSMELAARHPELVRRLVMVDITPGVNQQKAKAVIDFVDGPQTFASFDDLLARTIEHNPTRTQSSLRRGILHNAHQSADGSWQWNYDRRSHARSRDPEAAAVVDVVADATSSLSPLWDDFGSIQCPILLVRGSLSPVVDDADVAEATRRQPTLQVEVIDGAGHSIQGDRPRELADLIRDAVL
ncbi:MAG: alpha/beta hydrolase [Actinomycetota bacterium]